MQEISLVTYNSKTPLRCKLQEKLPRISADVYSFFCYHYQGFCKQEEVVFTLDDIQRDHPNALRHALYWICRAKLAEHDGDHERVVCMFEQAFAFSAQVIHYSSQTH